MTGPRWEVWSDDLSCEEASARIIEGSKHADDAATTFVEDSDSQGDYEVVSGQTVLVKVRLLDGDGETMDSNYHFRDAKVGEVLVFTVSGESVPQYTANALDDREVALIDMMVRNGWEYDPDYGKFSHWRGGNWWGIRRVHYSKTPRLREMLKWWNR